MLLNTWSELGCPVITQLPGEPPMNDRGPEIEGFLCLVGGAVTKGTDLYLGVFMWAQMPWSHACSSFVAFVTAEPPRALMKAAELQRLGLGSCYGEHCRSVNPQRSVGALDVLWGARGRTVSGQSGATMESCWNPF